MNNAIEKEALNNLLSYNSILTISNDSSKIKNSQVTLQEFIDNNSTLQGVHWDLLRNKMSKYNYLLSGRAQLAETVTNAIKKAVKLLLDYLGDDLYLDNSQLEELDELKMRITRIIANLESQINSMITHTYMLDDGTEETRRIHKYSADLRNNFKERIEEYKLQLREVDRLIAKIEGLAGIYAQANSIIDEARINSFVDKSIKIKGIISV